jgi:6-phospho-beta-glucosidase
MAAIKIAYVGGGSTSAPGTMASFIESGEDFAGSEIVLVDLDPSRLEIVARLAENMIRSRGCDLTVSWTIDRRQALVDCDAVLSSFRPGGFEARVQDERIPLSHGVIGQETQGPGGFFMGLRAVSVLKAICAEVEEICPQAWIFNYTNPVNIVAQAITANSPVSVVSLCEGPILFTERFARAASLEPARLKSTMIGLNHACWSVEHTYDGVDVMPLVREAWEQHRDDPSLRTLDRRMLRLALAMDAIPAEYFQYYYFRDDVLEELRARPTTRAEDILSWTGDYWAHYEQQSHEPDPQLDPGRSRGGLHELELAIDVMDAIFNDKNEVHPVNRPNDGGVLQGFPETLVVEMPGCCSANGIAVAPQPPLPTHVRGLIEMLAEYQLLAADAAWSGDRRQAIRALASNPLVMTLELAERLFAEMAAAHAAYLPARLLN